MLLAKRVGSVYNGVTPMATTWGQRVGKLVARRRHELGLTQKELAARAGLSRPLVGGLECGLRPRPTEETIEKLSIALEWPILAHAVQPERLEPTGSARRQRVGAGLGGRDQADRRKERPWQMWQAWQSPRPLVEYAACGVPSPVDGMFLVPDDERFQFISVPDTSEQALRQIGPYGYAVRTRGQSMTRWRIQDGDIVWVNPQRGRAYGLNRPVLARLMDVDGLDLGMVVKVLKMDEDGHEYLKSDGDEGDDDARYYSFEFFAPCVWWQPQGGSLVREAPAESDTVAARRAEVELGAEAVLDRALAAVG